MKIKAIKPLKVKDFQKSPLKKKPPGYAGTPPWWVVPLVWSETRTTSRPLLPNGLSALNSWWTQRILKLMLPEFAQLSKIAQDVQVNLNTAVRPIANPPRRIVTDCACFWNNLQNSFYSNFLKTKGVAHEIIMRMSSGFTIKIKDTYIRELQH